MPRPVSDADYCLYSPLRSNPIMHRSSSADEQCADMKGYEVVCPTLGCNRVVSSVKGWGQGGCTVYDLSVSFARVIVLHKKEYSGNYHDLVAE